MHFTKLLLFACIIITCNCAKKIHQPRNNLTFIFDFDATLHNSKVPYPSLLGMSVLGEEKFLQLKPEIINYVEKMRKQGLSDVIIVQNIAKKYNIRIQQKDIDFAAPILYNSRTRGLESVVSKLREDGYTVLIIGGGLWGCAIIPEFAKHFGIEKSNIFSGYFKDFSDQEVNKALTSEYRYINCGNLDLNTPVSDKKSELIKFLRNKRIIKGKIVHIGDGENDLEVWKAGQADFFIGFGINRLSTKVQKDAPIFVTNIKDLKTEISKIKHSN